jgi:hypothetical protein
MNPNPNQKIKWHTQTWEREGTRTSLQRQGARGRGRPWVHQQEGAASGGGVAEEERSRCQGVASRGTEAVSRGTEASRGTERAEGKGKKWAGGKRVFSP